jgi:starch synthase
VKVLFASSEAHPLIKTGGLADVSGSLPRALHNLGHELRLVLPGYQAVMSQPLRRRSVGSLIQDGYEVTLWQTTLPGSHVTVWLVDCPPLFDRPGNPYHDEEGEPWQDNAQRFALFSRVVARLSLDQAGLGWLPDIVHCNDWQTGLVAVELRHHWPRPAILFTIHNLAYQGLFSYETFQALALDAELWRFDRLEFHHQLSFIKGGLVYADRLNTVSPRYAEEIQSADFGHAGKRLSGILNGIDEREWNPGSDPHLVTPYNRQTLERKRDNKLALQREVGLPQQEQLPLLGLVGRLVQQKGIDLLLEILPKLPQQALQLVVLGSGERELERELREFSAAHPEQVAVIIGYDEALAHRIEAGCDIFLMPSRFEPCGLNQIYSLRYGTLPLVSPVGGLADTVVDSEAQGRSDATGFVMGSVSGAALLEALSRALHCYADKERWRQLQRNAMSQDFSWQHSAREYLLLYRQTIAEKAKERG